MTPGPIDAPALPDMAARKTSRLIAAALAICVTLVIAGAVAGVLWLSREHDALAADNQRLMVQGGIQNRVSTLEKITLDFAIWPDAVAALARDDIDWVWSNIGISAADTQTTDLMMVVPTGGRPAYGWTPGMEEEPSYELLEPAVIETMMRDLDAVPRLERRAPSRFAEVGGELWLLAAGRIVSNDLAEVPEDDAAIPRLIFGYRITDELLGGIGRAFLIDDLRLAGEPQAGLASVPIPLSGGEPLRYAVWSPFAPGPQVLKTLGLPLLGGIVALIAISVVCGRFIIGITRQLESAFKRARAADIAKTEFLASVSHELRTPMNGIMGITSLLERTDLNPEQRRMLSILSSSADSQMHLISDLLDIAMIERGQLRLGRRPFSIADALGTVIDLQRLEAEKKGIRLEADLSGAPALVLGDAGRFKQIAQNLVSNAIQATREGWVRVRVSAEEQAGGARVLLEVADTGCGIPAEDRERIFERFVRLQGIAERGHRGTGLGLTITRSLISLMGGSLSFESEVGKGTVFRVEIPFLAAQGADLRESAA